MKIPDFILRFAGKQVAKQLDLKEGPVGIKKWYQSKVIWSDIVTAIVGIVGLVDTHFTGGKIATNPAYGTILIILSGIGVYGRKTANTQIQ